MIILINLYAYWFIHVTTINKSDKVIFVSSKQGSEDQRLSHTQNIYITVAKLYIMLLTP